MALGVLLLVCPETARCAEGDDFSDGVRLLRAGEIQGARDRFASAIDADPGDGRAYMYTAMCHEKLGQWAEAQKHWEAYQALAEDSTAKQLAVRRIRQCKAKQLTQPSLPMSVASASSRELGRAGAECHTVRSRRFIVRARNAQLAELAGEHAERCLTQLCRTFMRGVAWPRVITIEIFRDHPEYLRLSGMPAWSTGGFVYRPMGVDNITRRVYLVQLDQKGQFASDLLPEVLPHELTHLVLREYFGERPIPMALNEGLAMYMEAGNRADRYDWPAYQAAKGGKHFPLATLYAAYGYPKGRKRIWLFYSQSASATRFLVDSLGPAATAVMLEELKHGQTMQIALRKATGRRGRLLGSGSACLELLDAFAL